MTQDELHAWLGANPNWNVDGDYLTCTYTFKDFAQAIGFVVQVSLRAEKHNHHPKIENIYNVVTISTTTQDAGNKITERDTKLAKDIENINIH